MDMTGLIKKYVKNFNHSLAVYNYYSDICTLLKKLSGRYLTTIFTSHVKSL